MENVLPAIWMPGNAQVEQGKAFAAEGSFTDPGQDPWLATVDYGDGSAVQVLSLAADKTFSLEHVYSTTGDYLEDGAYRVCVTVTDPDGDAGSGTLLVTVRNVAPTVSVSDPARVVRGCPVVLTGAFTDPGADAWSGLVDFGDGSQAQPLALNADKTFAASHVYAIAGEYTVSVTVTDDGLESGVFSGPIRVVAPISLDTFGVYNPLAAFNPYIARFLKNSNDATGANLIEFGFGANLPGWLPMAGDWNEDGVDTIGLFSPSNAHFHLKDSHDGTGANLVDFGFGVELMAGILKPGVRRLPSVADLVLAEQHGWR